MASLVCINDCQQPTWAFLGVHLLGALVFWCALFVFGLTMVYRGATGNVDSLRGKVASRRGHLRSNLTFVLLEMAFSLWLVFWTCVRSFTKRGNTMSFFVEAVGCCFFLIDFLLSWAEAHLEGFFPGLLFMCSKALLDCLLIPSVFAMALPTTGERTWLSLSFLATFHLLQSWEWLFYSLKLSLQIPRWRALNLLGSAVILIIFAALAIMTTEILGDPDLLHSANDGYWSTISSIYFVVASVSLVNYGDIVASTALGRLFVLLAVISGVYTVGLALLQVVEALVDQRSGRGAFRPGVRTRHIIVAGTPTAAQTKDFISELLHPDHADDREDLHVVFLFPEVSNAMAELEDFLRLKQNIATSTKVSLIRGSVLNSHDLQRVAAPLALAVFVLPNMLCENPMQEDAENIIRMMAVRRFTPNVRVILVLLKAESRGILEDAGLNVDMSDTKQTIIAADQFKLELVGKSMVALGFVPLICNLCKCASSTEEANKPHWKRDYEKGLENELYEIELSTVYNNRKCNFIEVVTDVTEQTGGRAYLIGLVELYVRDARRQILINPGPDFPIKARSSGVRTFGIFIAPDRESVIQCEANMAFLGKKERPNRKLRKLGRGEEAAQTRARTIPETEAESEMNKLLGLELQQRTKLLVGLARVYHKGMRPTRPPLTVLATGGHILFLCIGVAKGRDLRLGIQYFVKPLRLGKGKENSTPIVVLSPEVPGDWDTVANQPHVYFMRGSPLSELDLERVHYRQATAIFICNVSSSGGAEMASMKEGWVFDSEAICCSRLVESKLKSGLRALVIADLKSDDNHRFLPVPPTSNTGSQEEAIEDHFKRSSTTYSAFSSWASTPTGARSSMSRHQRGSMSNRNSALMKARTFRASISERLGTADSIEDVHSHESTDYFSQPRFASGQLFVNTVISSLAVNTFYNPSLSAMVSSMIEADVSLVPVPPTWVGKTYLEYFDHLLYMEFRLAVGVLRRADPAKLGAGGTDLVQDDDLDDDGTKRRFAFVITSPPGKEVILQPSDRLICFNKMHVV